MDKENMMPVAVDQGSLWTLNADRLTVRLALPPLPLADLPPINVKLDFDAATVDAMIERLAILRGQMLPPRKATGRAASPTGAMNGDDPPKRLRRRRATLVPNRTPRP